MKNLLLVVLALLMTACGNRTGDDLNQVTVQEVIGVNNYTYLLVERGREEFWIAVPAMDAHPGEVYNYQGGMEMRDFYSKELDRTFDVVFFADGLSRVDDSAAMERKPEMNPAGRPVQERIDVEINHEAGTTAISELYAHPDKYEGKRIRVSGVVTKVNQAIMGKNWLHLQDGTEFEGAYDLTLTSDTILEVGVPVSMEGVLSKDRDFGYGYTYEILLEEAEVIK